MRRSLLYLALLAAAALFILRLFRAVVARRSPERRAAAPRRDLLVRDRICDTFIPRSGALVLRAPDGVHYFCSEECRERHRAGLGRSSGAA